MGSQSIRSRSCAEKYPNHRHFHIRLWRKRPGYIRPAHTQLGGNQSFPCARYRSLHIRPLPRYKANVPEAPATSFSPSLVNIPHLATNNEGKTYMLLSSTRADILSTADVSFWCLATIGADLRWEFIEDADGSIKTLNKPAIVFHSPRWTNGNEISPNTGHLIATVTKRNGDTQRSIAFLSKSALTTADLHPSSPPNAPPAIFQRWSIRYNWPSDHVVSNAFFEDPETAATKGLAVLTPPSTTLQIPAVGDFSSSIQFLPFADGTYSVSTPTPSGTVYGLRGGNDFEVMEKHLCRKLLNTEQWPCR